MISKKLNDDAIQDYKYISNEAFQQTKKNQT